VNFLPRRTTKNPHHYIKHYEIWLLAFVTFAPQEKCPKCCVSFTAPRQIQMGASLWPLQNWMDNVAASPI
jgi:hypothetical protein